MKSLAYLVALYLCCTHLVLCFSFRNQLANSPNHRIPSSPRTYEEHQGMLTRGRRGGGTNPEPYPAYPYAAPQPLEPADSEPGYQQSRPFRPGSFNSEQGEERHPSADSANVGHGAQPAAALVDSTNTDADSNQPCDKSNCPPVNNCINETTSEGACCPSCDRLGCRCQGYQYYDCLLNGFVGGLVPEGESYSVDDGSTMCSCPMGGGMILCSFQSMSAVQPVVKVCPKPRPFCIQTFTRPADGCEECLAVGCVAEDGQKYQGGVNFDRPPCTVCYCPPEGGDILCATDHECQERTKQQLDPAQTSLALEATQRVMRDPIANEAQLNQANTGDQSLTKGSLYNIGDMEGGYDTRYLQSDWNKFDSSNPAYQPKGDDGNLGTQNSGSLAVPPLAGSSDASETVAAPGVQQNFGLPQSAPNSHESTQDLSYLPYNPNSFAAQSQHLGPRNSIYNNYGFNQQYPPYSRQQYPAFPYQYPSYDSGRSPNTNNLAVGSQEPNAGNVDSANSQSSPHQAGSYPSDGGNFRQDSTDLSDQTGPNSIPDTSQNVEAVNPQYPGYPANQQYFGGLNYAGYNSQNTGVEAGDLGSKGQNSDISDLTEVRPDDESPQLNGYLGYPSYLNPQYGKVGNPADTSTENDQPSDGLNQALPPNAGFQHYSQYPSYLGQQYPSKLVPENGDRTNQNLAYQPQYTGDQGIHHSDPNTATGNTDNAQQPDRLGISDNYMGYRQQFPKQDGQHNPQVPNQGLNYPLPPYLNGGSQGQGYFKNAENPALSTEEESNSANSDVQIPPLRNVRSGQVVDSQSSIEEPGIHSTTAETGEIPATTTSTIAAKTTTSTVRPAATTTVPTSTTTTTTESTTTVETPAQTSTLADTHHRHPGHRLHGVHLDSHNNSGSFENVLTACCYQGKQWALDHNSCTGIRVNVKTYSQICAVAQEKCCLEAEEQENCDRGIAAARSMAVCDAPTAIHGQCERDGFKSCCDCCALGLKAYGLSLSCDMEILGEPCNSAYSECCRKGRLTTSPGHSPKTSPPPAQSVPPQNITVTESSGPRCATSDACDHICTDISSGIQCSCREGYSLEEDGFSCNDINECNLATHTCLVGQICFNTIGSFTCQRLISCGTGYELTDRNTCDDIDECQLNIHNCGGKLDCVNIRGSFRCVPKSCDAGYFTDAVGGCTDIDECRSIEYTCPAGTHCRNTVGSYECVCPVGFILNVEQQSCEDIDECALGFTPCLEEGATCVNTEGSFTCMNRPSLTCTAGYQLNLDGDGCIDVDECESNSHECSTGSTCINEDGSYRCQDPIFCRPGTRPSENQRSCIDIDECEDPEVHQCGEGAQCVNVPGSFRCTCNRGYRRTLQNGRTHCEEINECALAAGERCTYRCENTPGSYTCVCPNGYNLVRFDGTCKDIDECASGSHNCSESETCFNTRGGFKCVEITCPEHYARLSNKKRCVRQSCKAARNKRECIRRPKQITYHNISLRNNAAPSTTVFRLSLGKGYPRDRYFFILSKGNKDKLFRLAKRRYKRRKTGIMYTTRRLTGPNDYVVDLTLKLYRKKKWTTFISRLYIFVSEFDF